MPAFTPPPLPSDDKRWKIVNGTMRKNGFARHALIETLHTVQSSFGYLDDDAIKFVAQSLRVPLSQAYGVVTFYHYFSLKPPGKHTVTVCAGTACYIKGADKLIAAAEKKLGVAQGQTTKDGNISLMVARCVGACSRAPVVLSRRRSQGRNDRGTDARAAGKVDRRMTIEELEQIAKSVHQDNAKYDYEVNVCMDLACASQGADKLREALVKAAEASGKKVLIRKTGCMGPCSSGPLVRVDPEETLYAKVKDASAEAIVNSLGDKPVPELQCDLNEHFDKQVRVVLENAGHIDPEKIDDYISRDGYKALLTALLEMTPNGVVHRITESGLRGRGGGGYPTGLKWSTVAKAGGDMKYVVCNGDEGDPGAFMDRSVMEGDPHRVIEGMAIAAYAVGASKGFIYVRAEYPVAVARLTTAIREARRRGLLGNCIGGTTFNFDIEIRLGAGAFVCGEETALIASIEGRRGTPKPRPPYPAVSGLWGKPTLINNVETYANIAPIVRNGGKWFFNMGSERSKGTKVFALTGKITNTGLIEVPLGIKLREIIEDIGGGVPGGHKLKAVQTGGPLGRMHSRRHAGPGRQLRRADGGRLDHGLGRHDRHGRHVVHGQRGALLHRVLHDRVVRQMHSLPRRHGADAHAVDAHLQRHGNAGGSRTAGRPVRHGEERQPVRPGPDRAQPGAEHAEVLPQRVHRTHRAQALPGRRVHHGSSCFR